jgi:glyoxylase-like metal-dependent hydrolase (beta-lactamase superfamily II)
VCSAGRSPATIWPRQANPADLEDSAVPEPARIIPIACPFGPAGTVFVYYIDAPQPALIDIGVAGSPEGTIEPALAAQGIKLADVKWILASHGHWDHIGGAGTGKARAHPDVKLALHPADAELLADPKAHIRGYQGVRFRYVDDPALYAAHDALLLENLSGEMGADRPLADGDRIDLGGGVSLTTVHTPGHSAGAVTFMLDGTDWAFTGDSIQGYGAGASFPLIEHPTSYRASLERLIEDVRPTRLMMGHRFGGLDRVARDNVLDGEGAATMLRESSALAEQLAALAPTLQEPADRPNDPRQFAPVAELIGANTGDPTSWPASIFLTMDAFRRASRG